MILSWKAAIGRLAALPVFVAMSVSPVDGIRLEWSAPDECPSRADTLRAVATVLGTREGTRVKGGTRQEWNASIVVTKTPEHWRADVMVSDGMTTSTRSVEGGSCVEIADAAALILALSIDPAADDRGPSDSPEAAPLRAVSFPARRLFFVGATLWLDSATLPEFDQGAALVAGWRPPHLRLEAEIGFLRSVDGTLRFRPAQGASFWLARAALRGCLGALDGAFDIGPCGAIGIESIEASGFGSPRPADSSARITTASLGGFATARLSSRLYLRGTLEVARPFTQPTFVIDDVGLVHRPSSFALRTGAGLEAHF